jgi:hypothetical protein
MTTNENENDTSSALTNEPEALLSDDEIALAKERMKAFREERDENRRHNALAIEDLEVRIATNRALVEDRKQEIAALGEWRSSDLELRRAEVEREEKRYTEFLERQAAHELRAEREVRAFESIAGSLAKIGELLAVEEKRRR